MGLAAPLLRIRRTAMLVPMAVGLLIWFSSIAFSEKALGQFLQSPLLAPFSPSVDFAPGAAWDWALRWLRVLASIAFMATLPSRGWRLGGIVWLLLSLPRTSNFLPEWNGWGALGLALLLRGRRPEPGGWREALAGTVLAVGLAADGIMIVLSFSSYQASVDPRPLQTTLLLLLGLASGSLAARRYGSFLLPGAVLASLGLLLTAHGSVRHHHDAPVPSGACAGLDVAIIDSLAPLDGVPWSVLELSGGYAVGGNGALLMLDHRGRPGRMWSDPHWFRIAVLIPDGSGGLYAAASGAGLRVQQREGEWELTEQQRFGNLWPEISEVALGPGGPLWATVEYPYLLHGTPIRATYYAGHGFPGFINSVPAGGPGPQGVLVGDGWSVSILDPRSLARRDIHRFAPWDFVVDQHLGERFLYRANVIGRTIDIVEPRTLELVRRISLPFRPRYLAVDEVRKRLLVPDFLTGRAALVDETDGTIHGWFRVGPRPRGLVFSRREQAFLGVSACGLYRIPILR
jgi:hypothetical protein